MPTTQRRSAIEISIFVVCFFAVWSVRATYLYSIDESLAPDAVRTVYSTLVKAILWGGAAFGFACWIRHSSPFQYLGLTSLPSARQWIVCLVAIGLFLGAVAGFETIAERKELSFIGISLTVTIPGVLATFVSPLLEEILFRGLLLKEFSGLLPRWGANLLTSLLFAGVHLPFWLSHGGSSATVLANTAGVFIFSLLAGWLYQKSSSTWPPYLAHVANNCLAALWVVSRG